MNKTGLIQTYTGGGKGKTTSSFGLVFRALSYNWKILIVQFLKCDPSGEIKSCSLFKNNITVLKNYDSSKIVMEGNKTLDDELLCQDLMNKAMDHIFGGAYDLIVLDEILPALCLNLLSQKQVFDIIKNKARNTELVLTGRIWDEEIYDKIKNVSDLMSDIRCVKHYFDKSCPNCKRKFEFRSNYCPNCGDELITVSSREGIEK